jgi:hypothetical protein
VTTIKSAGGGAVFVGLDFVLDEANKWVVIEANDIPLGLLFSDTAAAKVDRPVFSGSGCRELASALASDAGAGAVILLLTEGFSLPSGVTAARFISLPRSPAAPAFAAHVVEDLNRIALLLRELGCEAYIVSPEQFLRDGGYRFAECSISPGALLDRTRNLIAGPTGINTTNRFGIKAMCRNKHVMTRALTQLATPAYRSPESMLVERTTTSEMAAFTARTAHRRAIVKPVLGFGSLGVRLVSLSDFEDDARLVQHFSWPPASEFVGALGGPMLQEWIRPPTARCNGKIYCFDLRIFAVNGRAVGGYARRAAAPFESPFRDTEIGWLTTTGPYIPLGIGKAADEGGRSFEVDSSGTLRLPEALVRSLEGATAAIVSDILRLEDAVTPALFAEYCGPPAPAALTIPVLLDAA